jgi:septum formation inhibitor-activating ATPase MinD
VIKIADQEVKLITHKEAKMNETLNEKVMAPVDETLTGKFLIVVDQKRIVKASAAGQVVEALKRAKAPMTIAQIATRVKATKAGKELSVKDLKARVAKVVKWYVKHSPYVLEEAGKFRLTREGDVSAV